MLTERKKHILRAIVDDYVLNAEPVGSKYLVDKYKLDISSATVRNEMSELEELGYLENHIHLQEEYPQIKVIGPILICF